MIKISLTLLLPALLSTSLVAQVSRLESDPARITWKDLATVRFTRAYHEMYRDSVLVPHFTDSLLALDGKIVLLKGYALPMTHGSNQLILSANPFASCFFCSGGNITTIMEVDLWDYKRYNLDEVATFKGTLLLLREPGYGPFFKLEDAEEY